MKLKEKIICVALIASLFFLLVYAVRSVLMPFICSMVIAYFLNPLVNRFHHKYRISRLRSTSLILGLFLSALISSGLLIFPVIYSQTIDFFDSVPDYLKIFTNDFYPKILATAAKLGFDIETHLTNSSLKDQMTAKALNFSKDVLTNFIGSSSAVINILSLIFIMPILLFYFLKDWDVMVSKINEYLPRSASSQVRRVISDIDKTMSGYIRGQFNVCLMLGVFYAALLSCTGLNFGFLIGFMTGMLVFIPYVGMLIGVTTAIVVALFQWGLDLKNIGLLSVVFLIGQILESNFLTPKLVGDRIGLHPLWLIFGLFFFGITLGFVGILFAVPLTAIVGVILKHLAAEYKKRFV